MPFINKTKKFVFIGNARCGSTSMYQQLGQAFSEDEVIWEAAGPNALPWLYHMGVKETLENYPFTEKFYKFCFTRNPWSRMVSAYKEFQCPSHLSWSHPILGYKNFEHFCLDFYNNPLMSDIHFKPVYKQIMVDQQICVDEIGKFENIEQDFERIVGKFKSGIKLEIHSRNTNSSNYRTFYTENSREIVRRFYKDDIKFFGYEF